MTRATCVASTQDGPMGQRDEQPHPRLLPLGEIFDLRGRIEHERPPQFLRVGVIHFG